MGESEGEHHRTRIIGQRELNVDGVSFEWWAVGERPTLVTVRTRVFGALSEFTDEDPADHAIALAKRLLKQHYDQVSAAKLASRSSSGDGSVLEKPGWFDDGDEVDFSSTNV